MKLDAKQTALENAMRKIEKDFGKGAIIPHVSVTFMPQWSTCISEYIDYKDFDEEPDAWHRDFDIPKKSLFTYFGSNSAYNYMLSGLRLNFGLNIYL